MRIDIITLFPEMFTPVLGDSIIGRAQKAVRLKYIVINCVTMLLTSTDELTIPRMAAEWEC